jgi:hypothetical protein
VDVIVYKSAVLEGTTALRELFFLKNGEIEGNC